MKHLIVWNAMETMLTEALAENRALFLADCHEANGYGVRIVDCKATDPIRCDCTLEDYQEHG